VGQKEFREWLKKKRMVRKARQKSNLWRRESEEREREREREKERDEVDLRTEKQRWVKWLVGFVYVFIDGGERDLSKLESLVCNGGNQREKQ
jgi:hypothetical protein